MDTFSPKLFSSRDAAETAAVEPADLRAWQGRAAMGERHTWGAHKATVTIA